ncbi:hypothetical protein TRFO_09745 [Tritrichomonas foetus]|uniref:Uncharacterized protein n=1 Tax=Tritrichomonas foetus TaxID=1144522 RepID=A0A1J4JCC1_9EUKA|nr:hypothetical protein TRFO_09745 [Tritrichomonas foetus]|eukprot:OHS96850.1 hypothetical protein TRFO_09745 [Tritrichomonas foetus]
MDQDEERDHRMIRGKKDKIIDFNSEESFLKSLSEPILSANMNISIDIKEPLSLIIEHLRNVNDSVLFFDLDILIGQNFHQRIFDIIQNEDLKGNNGDENETEEIDNNLICLCVRMILLFSNGNDEHVKTIFTKDVFTLLLQLLNKFIAKDKLVAKPAFSTIKNLLLINYLPDEAVHEFIFWLFNKSFNVTPTNEKCLLTTVIKHIFRCIQSIIRQYFNILSQSEINGFVLFINKWVNVQIDRNEDEICISCINSALNCMNDLIKREPTTYHAFYTKEFISNILIQHIQSNGIKMNGLRTLKRIMTFECPAKEEEFHPSNYLTDYCYYSIEAMLNYEDNEIVKIYYSKVMSAVIRSPYSNIDYLTQYGIISRILQLSDSPEEPFKVRTQATLAIAENMSYLTNIEVGYLVTAGVIKVLVRSIEILENDNLETIFDAIDVILNYLDTTDPVSLAKYLEEFIQNDVLMIFDQINENPLYSDKYDKLITNVTDHIQNLIEKSKNRDVYHDFLQAEKRSRDFVSDDFDDLEYDNQSDHENKQEHEEVNQYGDYDNNFYSNAW